MLSALSLSAVAVVNV